jgi:hypothetical protein
MTFWSDEHFNPTFNFWGKLMVKSESFQNLSKKIEKALSSARPCKPSHNRLGENQSIKSIINLHSTSLVYHKTA